MGNNTERSKFTELAERGIGGKLAGRKPKDCVQDEVFN
jgi:hypothetical protein